MGAAVLMVSSLQRACLASVAAVRAAVLVEQVALPHLSMRHLRQMEKVI